MRARWHVRVNLLVVAWLAAAAVVAGGHRWFPAAGWLMVHLLLLGAVSTAILIWSAHFAEAVRRRPLRGGHRGQAKRLGLHTAGALAVVSGLLSGTWSVVASGALAVAAGAVWHAVVLVEVSRRGLGVRLGWTSWYFVAAAACLPVGAALGAFMARPETTGALAARAYVAHVVVMLLGWVGVTVLGTLVTLWPTMLRVTVADGALPAARRALGPLVGGVAVTVAGALAGSRAVAAAGLLLYLSGLAVAVGPWIEQARRRRPEGFAPWSVAAAVLWYGVAVTAAVVAVVAAPDWPGVQAGLRLALPLLAAGFAAQVLLGALSHLGPMILGGGPAAVRTARAVMERGAGARLVLVNGGLVLFALPAPSLVRVGASALALAGLVVTPVLLVRAAVVSRRVRRTAPVRAAGAAPVTITPAEVLATRRASGGPALAAGVALVLVVAAGVAADPAAVGLGAAASGGVTASGRVVEVEVEAQDMRFEPASVEVAAGDRLVLVVTNVDSTVHDLVLDSGAASGRLAAGATTRVDVGVVGRPLAGWCSVAGHRQMGMTFDVVVTGGPAAATAAGTTDPAAGADHAVGSSGARVPMDLLAPPGPGVAIRDAALPPARSGTVHRVTLAVTEQEQEVAPGVRRTVWTFGGTFPGPTLRGTVGDTFEITLVNDGSLGHSIDFHAGALAPDRPMRTIEPGESLTYTFTANRSGVWMYHCSTMPMSLHIANGMFGAVVIDPPGLPPVDREYLVVQSELYVTADPGPDDATTDGRTDGIAGLLTDTEKLLLEQPDGVVFNGHASQYRHRPLEARVGERVRFWVLDAGPNRSSAFHVVGGQFDTVYSEGAYLLGGPSAVGGDPTGGAQVLALEPAQGGFVELVLPEAGTYPFVSHRMVDAERGASGLLRVGP
ncbi:multicopper oxidase domain-containing protein [Actinotalea sp. Marseille-Q4924]|uniref:multicopper oxidase domain-containing protein n=1 Tax=Actinotalea sp. Marseille-Q4924 TaxID=2866571 RepID=UPI001CE3EC0E|nr:multicopper oxidase domain-containing protein [Actinotalea sp. Marseille-Q4924]